MHGVTAEASRTSDPYDPWEPDAEPTTQAKAKLAHTVLARQERVPSAPADIHSRLRAGVAERVGVGGAKGQDGAGKGKYETATRVFKAASAAYEAAAQTWRELEAKEAQAQAEQAKLSKSLETTAPAQPSSAHAHARGAGGKPEHKQAAVGSERQESQESHPSKVQMQVEASARAPRHEAEMVAAARGSSSEAGSSKAEARETGPVHAGGSRRQAVRERGGERERVRERVREKLTRAHMTQVASRRRVERSLYRPWRRLRLLSGGGARVCLGTRRRMRSGT